MVSSLVSRHAVHSMVSTIKATTCRSSLTVDSFSKVEYCLGPYLCMNRHRLAISNAMHQSSRSDIQSILIEGIYAGCSLKSSCVVALIGTSHQFGPSWIRVLIYESMIYRVSWTLPMSVRA